MIGPIGARGRDLSYWWTRSAAVRRVSKAMPGPEESLETDGGIKPVLSEIDSIRWWRKINTYLHRMAGIYRGIIFFCFTTSNWIRQERREEQRHPDWLEFSGQVKASPICGNQWLPSQGQTDGHWEAFISGGSLRGYCWLVPAPETLAPLTPKSDRYQTKSGKGFTWLEPGKVSSEPWVARKSVSLQYSGDQDLIELVETERNDNIKGGNDPRRQWMTWCYPSHLLPIDYLFLWLRSSFATIQWVADLLYTQGTRCSDNIVSNRAIRKGHHCFQRRN